MPPLQTLHIYMAVKKLVFIFPMHLFIIIICISRPGQDLPRNQKGFAQKHIYISCINVMYRQSPNKRELLFLRFHSFSITLLTKKSKFTDPVL